MADNGIQNGRQTPAPVVSDGDEGKGYHRQQRNRSQAILNNLMGYLASTYRAQIPSSEYALHLRSMAQELARLTLHLEQLRTNVTFERIQSEFFEAIMGELLFIDDGVPRIRDDDEAYRSFLLTLVELYFEGSTPDSIREAITLVTDESVDVHELFERSDQPDDQFRFRIDFQHDDAFGDAPLETETALETILDIIRPAHTLYDLRHVFNEQWARPETTSMAAHIDDRQYEDIRIYPQGMAGWSSATGQLHAKNRLSDPNHPITEVAKGVTLTIDDGANAGQYRVIDHHPQHTPPTVTMYPPVDVMHNDAVSYRVRVDRKGSNREEHIQTDATEQSKPEVNLQVELEGPYTVIRHQSVTIQAQSNYQHVQYRWDLSGDGQFDDATGASVTVPTDGQDPNPKVVRVEGKSTLFDGSNDRPLERDRARGVIQLL